MNPIHLLTRASRIAAGIPRQEFPLAAVAVRADGAIVQASNKAIRATTPRGTTPARLPNTHAEIRLCRKLDYHATVFVARVSRNGEWAMAKPCDRCLDRLRRRRVRVVYFTTKAGEYGMIRI